MAEQEARDGEERRGQGIKVTAAQKNEFLAFLAATCNVRAAAVHAGISPNFVYPLRLKDAKFRARWADALAAGYEMLETQLVGHALAGGGPVLDNGDVGLTEPIDVTIAMQLLAQHRSGDVATSARKKGPPYKVVTAEQTDASILRKLKAMSRAKAAKQ